VPELQRLIDRSPLLDRQRLLVELQPAAQFAAASFANYLPSPEYPAQAQARLNLQLFAESLTEPRERRWRWGRRTTEARPVGRYLDGGFGVGKTHLLAALWHEAPRPKAFGTFMEFTQLIGALGFSSAVQELSSYRLLCIDEFELDDPGDTVLMSTLMNRLVAAGVQLAATSNTLPQALGAGRFAATDFTREIQGLARHFSILRLDGPDYRHRGLPPAYPPFPPQVVRDLAQDHGGTLDEFSELLQHLIKVHPSRYRALVEAVPLVGLVHAHPIADQHDRLYDAGIPLALSGCSSAELFAPNIVASGYQKKYQRAQSRLRVLCAQVRT
jgi:cell division protein ZapE